MKDRCFSCKHWWPSVDLKGRCSEMGDRHTSDIHTCHIGKWEPRTKADAFDAAFEAGVQVGYAEVSLEIARKTGNPERISRAERLLQELKEEAGVLQTLADGMEG